MILFCRNFSSRCILFLLVLLIHDFVLAQASPSTDKNIQNKVQSMSLDDKVGQLLMIGFPQTYLDQKLKDHIKKIHASSFIFFKRNILDLKQVSIFNSQLSDFTHSEINSHPLIAVDQEGGAVARITTYPSIPNAFSIGLTRNPEIGFQLGEETGKILRSYGFNMNLAPVLDLTDNKVENFIGLRSFSSNPETTTNLSYQFSNGLVHSLVLPTAKHFPGMTSIKQDPHHELIESTRTKEQILNIDLLPYKKYFLLGPNIALMMSHLIYPAIDTSKKPALLSRNMTTNFLRETLGYQGLIITDDIQMQSSMKVATTWENSIESLKAGADILILSWSFRDQEKTFLAIRQAIQDGQIPISEIDRKVERILKIKDAYKIDKINIPQQALKIHVSPKLIELENRIVSLNSMNLINHVQKMEVKNSICVYSSNKSFISSFQKEKIERIKFFQINAQINPSQLTTHLSKNGCDLNLLSIFGKATAASLSAFKDKNIIKKTLLVNFSHPSFIPADWPETQIFQAGFHHQNSGQALALTIQKARSQRYVSSSVDSKKEIYSEQGQDQRALERFPAAETPSAHHPKTQ